MKLLAIIAVIGILLTGYLTYIHYQPSAGVCPLAGQGGCLTVTSSAYSTIAGIPVSLMGLVFYVGLLYLSLKEEKYVKWWTLIGVIAAAYFNYLMIFKLQSACVWCESTHAMAITAFIIAHWKAPVKKTLITVAACIALGILLGMLMSMATANEQLAQCIGGKATMYGAWWCGHCNEQKQLFGKNWKYVNYIECSKQDKTQTSFCTEQNITSYPTWEFDGKRISKTLTLKELEELTDC